MVIVVSLVVSIRVNLNYLGIFMKKFSISNVFFSSAEMTSYVIISVNYSMHIPYDKVTFTNYILPKLLE
jgi:hypothetical protein